MEAILSSLLRAHGQRQNDSRCEYIHWTYMEWGVHFFIKFVLELNIGSEEVEELNENFKNTTQIVELREYIIQGSCH